MTDNSSIHILVVDDQESMRETMAGIFEMEGYTVTSFGDPLKAVEAAKTTTFNIAFLDIRMPGMNGVDLFMHIKQSSPTTVVFMMTAFAEEELIKKALREGAYACMSKPVNIENIIETIKNLKNKNAILIVDDDVRFAESLSKILGGNGFAVKTAPTGAQAINEMKGDQYKVILLNMKLPDVNGLELYQQIKNINPDTSVVMMNGAESDQNTANIVNKGGYLCLQKPFDPGTLIDLVKKYTALVIPVKPS